MQSKKTYRDGYAIMLFEQPVFSSEGEYIEVVDTSYCVSFARTGWSGTGWAYRSPERAIARFEEILRIIKRDGAESVESDIRKGY